MSGVEELGHPSFPEASQLGQSDENGLEGLGPGFTCHIWHFVTFKLRQERARSLTYLGLGILRGGDNRITRLHH